MTMLRSSALILATLTLAACQTSSASPDTEAQAAAVEAVRDGVTTLAPGQALSVSLPSNGTTGYSWSVAAFNEGVLTRGEPFGQERTDAHPAGMVGVGGQTHWRFIAAAPGETSLTFTYARPWEKDTPPVQTAHYTVRVR